MNPSIITSKSLGEPEHKLEREEMLRELEDQRLTHFVESIRKDRQCGAAVPYFDPADGGVTAECLFLLEAPGPKAVKSGFVSRDNPDETAKNWLKLNAQAGIPRDRTLMWNIVPWYLGENGHIRAANMNDINAGWDWLLKLLALLPDLRMVVLVGRKAQKVQRRLETELERRRTAIAVNVIVQPCPHPSPSFINRKPQENWCLVLAALQEVATTLAATERLH
jgi:uracil-DNA glycosylase